MNEKVIFNRPDGTQKEVKALLHFKVTSDDKPNIKNIPIIVADTGRNDNGNTILEFYYKKDGLYQPIKDDQAWQEVKRAIIELIKGEYEYDDSDI